MSQRDRLARLLFIVPYVAQRDGVPIEELAEKLDVGPVQLESDIDLLSLVGKPPLTPDHLVDLYIEEGIVYVDLDQNLTRPLRLTHEEALALALSVRLVGTMGGLDKDLDDLVHRIIQNLNPVEQEMVTTLSRRVRIAQDGPADGQPAALLREAVEQCREVRAQYYSASSDRLKRYTLRPLGMVSHSGAEYVVALDCDADYQQKLFRLDRVGRVVLTGAEFERPADVDLEKYRKQEIFVGSDVVDPPEVRFVAAVVEDVRRRHPEWELTELPDGAVSTRLPTSSATWVSRWVMPFGQGAEVVGPAHYRMWLARLCAEAAEAYREPV